MGHLLASDKERLRKAWMTMVSEGKVKLNKAAKALGIGYHQAKRIYRRFYSGVRINYKLFLP